jgi:gliding motility-associated-like protein
MRYLRGILLLFIFLMSYNLAQAQPCFTLDPAGTIPQTVCKNYPIVEITYSLDPGVTGINASGFPTGVGGVFSGNKYTISGSPSVSGTFTYLLSSSGCVDNTSGTITVKDTPVPPTAATPQAFCKIDNPTVASLAATGTDIKWYLNSSGGTSLPSTTALNTATYNATQTVDGCESTDRLPVNVIVNDPLPPTGVTPQLFCAINNPTVANLVAFGSGIQWYTVATGGTALSSSTALSTRGYYASQTIGGCESTSRLAISVTVGNPAAPTGSAIQNFCIADNPTVANLTATGSNIRWYLNPSGGTALLLTASLSTGTYYASQTVSGCESATRLAVSVTVSNPSAPTGTSPQNFCLINNPTVANLVATGTGIKWYTTPTGGSALAPATALVTGTYYASQTFGSCESPSRLAVAVVVSNPAAPTAASPQVFCAGNNPTVANLAATGSGILWYTTSTGGTALVTTTALVTGVYYASQTVSGCESTSRIAVIVSVNSPAAPTGNATQLFCSINNPTVANLTATGTGLKWYLTPTGGVALTTTTALATGVYYASQTVGGCESVLRFAVNVTVTNTPAPSGTAAQTFCSATNPTVASLVASGTGILWYLTSTGGLALAETTPLVSGNYYASQTISGCESALRFAVAVIVNQTPVSNAGTGGSACTLSFTLSGVSPTIGTGTWTQTSGPGTSIFSPNANTPNATVTVSAYGTYVFTWTVVSNNCSDTSSVTVNFYQQPLANPGVGGTECDLNFVLNAIPSVGVGTWARVTGPGTAVYSPNANIPGATVTVSAYGTYTFRWTETNGTCTSSSIVTVNFYQQPDANAGPGGDACNLNFALNAIPSAGLGTWRMTSGTGIATFTPSVNAPTATVTISEYGTKVFTWKEVNGICSDSSMITVNFYRQPVANAGTGGNNCGNEFNFSAIPSIGTGTWTRDSGPGNATFSPDANTPSAKVTVTAYGTHVFRWTEINGTCSSSETVTVTFVQQPAADAGPGGDECDLNFTLRATPGPGTGTWSKISGPGNAVFTPNANQYNTVVTVTQFGAYDFAWTEVNSLCSSADIVRVTFHDLPAVSAGTDLLLCKGKSIQLYASGNGTFSWSPADLLNNPNIYNPVATPELTTAFTVTLTDQWKCKNSDQVNVEVREQPVSDAGPDQVLEFLFETNFQAIAPGTNQSGEWTQLAGEGVISNVNDPLSLVSDLSLDVNSFIWSISNEVCPVASDTVNITVHNLIIPSLITPNLDGNNDFFVIKGIESFGQTSLTIFNRWGARVYENSKYDNSWEGMDDKGNPLPEDTYFYVLTPEKNKTFKGYVVIRR